jgi:hypothetical protein
MASSAYIVAGWRPPSHKSMAPILDSKFSGHGRSVKFSAGSRRYVHVAKSMTKSELCYDRRPVGQSLLESSPIWGPRLLSLSGSCGFVDVGRPL